MTRLRPSKRFLATAVCLLTTSSCVKWAADRVATGISRLTIRNVGAMVTLAGLDERCGFASPAVLGSPRIEGEVGGHGTVSWRVEGCTIGFPDWFTFSQDCNGVTKEVSGSFTITAEKRISGRLTGNRDKPVVPDTAESVRIDIAAASFDDFRVRQSNNESDLTMKSGSLSATVRPLLAVSADSGACAVATPNVTFEEVAYGEAELHVNSPDRSFDAEVQGGSLWAQNGKLAGTENSLQGELVLWGREEQVPKEGDEDGLDPDYDPETFATSWACLSGLTVPPRFDCSLSTSLAQGAARLTVRTFGTLLSVVNADSSCGFASAAVTTTASGAVGDLGEVTQTIRDCNVLFTEPTAASTDCNGVVTYVTGRAKVSGTKRVSGYVTGDPAAPVVPTSRDPATFELSAVLTGFEVTTSNSDRSLYVESGALSGIAEPRTALDTTTGACSVSTPVSAFRFLAWSDAAVELRGGDMRFGMKLDRSLLDAVSGAKGDEENWLAGGLTADGEETLAPSVLDPDYQPVLFEQSYACKPNTVIPQSDAECAFTPHLAQAAARLLIKSFGTLTKALDEDHGCGFASLDGLLPASLGGEAPDAVIAQWHVQDCALGGGASAAYFSSDCYGTETYLGGTARLSATKSVTGALALAYPPIQPIDRRSVSVEVDSIDAAGIFVSEYDSGSAAPGPYLVLHGGTLSGTLLPITGEAASAPGRFYVKTPVAELDQITAEGVTATLYSGAKRFNLTIDAASLEAFAGSYKYQSNTLRGSIDVDGQRYALPLDADDARLDPEFDQATFDGSYACREGLLEPVPATGN